jgi:uncharacterized protein
VQAFYLDAAAGWQGRRLCILHEPSTPPRMLVLHLHAFAEEMNKSRRMVAETARALAGHGAAVLVFDLLGCGDSSGEFSEARWDGWVEDATIAARWLQRLAPVPLWLWGHRAGCLLAAQAAVRLPGSNLLFWQPPASGKAVLQQFLRLKLASQLDSGQKGVVDRLRLNLRAGQAVEVAGYTLHPGLALGLEEATLDPGPSGPDGRVAWLEVGLRDEPQILPASLATLERLSSQGWRVEPQALHGPAFWQTTEIETAPQLLQATTDCLTEAPDGR